MNYYAIYVPKQNKFKVMTTTISKEEYGISPLSNIANPQYGTFRGIGLLFDDETTINKLCELANKYIYEENKKYDIPENCIKDAIIFNMIKCHLCGKFYMRNISHKSLDNKPCPYCRKEPGYETPNVLERKLKYVIAFKNNASGEVHKGNVSFDDETQAKEHCEELNKQRFRTLAALGEYIYVPVQED